MPTTGNCNPWILEVVLSVLLCSSANLLVRDGPLWFLSVKETKEKDLLQYCWLKDKDMEWC